MQKKFALLFISKISKQFYRKIFEIKYPYNRAVILNYKQMSIFDSFKAAILSALTI